MPEHVGCVEYISLSKAAAKLGVKPKLLSDLIWAHAIDTTHCPLIGRTRCIPVDLLPVIREVLVEKGKLAARPVRSNKRLRARPSNSYRRTH